jgi:hypothetical protein
MTGQRNEETVRQVRGTQSGFTLMETMIAMTILIIGVLALAMMLGSGLVYMNLSQGDYIAQEKAAEAVESIFTARDQGQATWSTICNVNSSICSSGIFVTGSTPLCDPGTDGIVGTADDFNGTVCAGNADAILVPNAAGNFNPPTRQALTNFTRTITVTNATDNSGNVIANLREIQVTITYSNGQYKNRAYTLTTYISNFS